MSDNNEDPWTEFLTILRSHNATLGVGPPMMIIGEWVADDDAIITDVPIPKKNGVIHRYTANEAQDWHNEFSAGPEKQKEMIDSLSQDLRNCPHYLYRHLVRIKNWSEVQHGMLLGRVGFVSRLEKAIVNVGTGMLEIPASDVHIVPTQLGTSCFIQVQRMDIEVYTENAMEAYNSHCKCEEHMKQIELEVPLEVNVVWKYDTVEEWNHWIQECRNVFKSISKGRTRISKLQLWLKEHQETDALFGQIPSALKYDANTDQRSLSRILRVANNAMVEGFIGFQRAWGTETGFNPRDGCVHRALMGPTNDSLVPMPIGFFNHWMANKDTMVLTAVAAQGSVE